MKGHIKLHFLSQIIVRTLIFVLALSGILGSFSLPAQALTSSIDLQTSTNFNLRVDGAGSDKLGLSGLHFADLNNNGLKDLIVVAPLTDYNSRANSGSVYVVYDSILSQNSGTGQTLDLNTSSNFSVRFDGAAAGEFGGDGQPFQSIQTGDLDNDSKPDLILSGYSSSRVYVIYNTRLDDFAGTGNTADLNSGTSYSLRYSGSDPGSLLGAIQGVEAADLDGDSKNELILGEQNASTQSRTSNGAVYVINNTLIDDYTGTGNNISLATGSNYTVRYDGSADSDLLGYTLATGDLTNDGRTDLIIGASAASFNGRGLAGSVYVVSGTLVDDNTGTGNTKDLGTASTYNLRYDGPADFWVLGSNLLVADIDNNSQNDLLINAYYANANSRSDSGSVYVIKNSLMTSHSGTGNNLDLATASNYSIRFDGGQASDFLGGEGIAVADLSGTGENDLLLDSNWTTYNGRSGAGAVYRISATQLATYSGTGNTVDLNDTSTYTYRYDGYTAGSRLAMPDNQLADINADGSPDLYFASYAASYNSRSSSGSIYILYTFPHTLSATSSFGSSTTTATGTVSGTVSATSSLTTVASVQYALDSSATSATWTSCTASDGSFDSTSESYSCAVNLGSLGAHTAYVRAKDSFNAYSRSAQLVSVSTTYALAPTPSPSPTPTATATSTVATRDQIAELSMNAPLYNSDGTVEVNGFYNTGSSGLDKILVRGWGNQPVRAGTVGASWSVVYANVPDGIYQFSAQLINGSGVEAQAVAANQTIVDRDAPSLIVQAPDITGDTHVHITGQVIDGLAGLAELTFTQQSLERSASPISLESDGRFSLDIPLKSRSANQILLVATDKAGHRAERRLAVTQLSTFGSLLSNNLAALAKLINAAKGLKTTEKAVVTALQQRLQELGFLKAKPTGLVGSQTQRAVRAAQATFGLKPTGKVDTRLLAKLDRFAPGDRLYINYLSQNIPGYSTQELQAAAQSKLTKDLGLNQRDDEVKVLQRKLYLLGYYNGPIQNHLNIRTQTAIRSYRADQRLPRGLVDKVLRDRLNSL